MVVKRFEVWIAQLEPTRGAEIRKARPVVIVSPDELNRQLQTVIVAPLTSGRRYSFRVPTRVQGREGVAAIDQLRAIDKQRLLKKLTTLRAPTTKKLLDAIQTVFEP